MNFKFDETEATATSGGNSGSKVLDSGVYPVEILTVSECVAKTGTKGLDWSLQIGDFKYPNMVYGMWLQKANGDAITMNTSIVQNLMGLTGKSYTVYNKTVDTKDGNKVVKAVKEFDNFKGYVAVVKVLDVYNGEIREKNEIRAFLGADKKTYAESVKKSEAKQFDYYSNNLKDVETSSYKKFIADGGSAEVEAPYEDDNEESLL